ncbi:MAG: hypothetical protein SGI77_05100 [Pirellulaceae bacterium]|nr:hypothetical protein [Pirellulaceae bacterium]
MRNWIGQRFVESRILYEEQFRRFFPSNTKNVHAKSSNNATSGSELAIADRRKQWAWRLTRGAKDELFNMFHNKSDDFLEHVAKGEIRIIGQPTDRSARLFYQYASEETIALSPDWIVPSIGYRSTIESLSDGAIQLGDFYLGCQSLRWPKLFMIGFARPIIGNIPSMSEMQANYVAGLISGRFATETKAKQAHQRDRTFLAQRFSKLNLNAIYPAEMFPYCDLLARRMGVFPSLARIGSLADWIRMQLAPATTIHYFWHDPKARAAIERLPIYMPRLLIVLLLLLKPIDWTYRILRRLSIAVLMRKNNNG